MRTYYFWMTPWGGQRTEGSIQAADDDEFSTLLPGYLKKHDAVLESSSFAVWEEKGMLKVPWAPHNVPHLPNPVVTYA